MIVVPSQVSSNLRVMPQRRVVEQRELVRRLQHD